MVQILLILICPAFISLGLPDSLLRKISNRTTNEAGHINRVVRGITQKPRPPWSGREKNIIKSSSLRIRREGLFVFIRFFRLYNGHKRHFKKSISSFFIILTILA